MTSTTREHTPGFHIIYEHNVPKTIMFFEHLAEELLTEEQRTGAEERCEEYNQAMTNCAQFLFSLLELPGIETGIELKFQDTENQDCGVINITRANELSIARQLLDAKIECKKLKAQLMEMENRDKIPTDRFDIEIPCCQMCGYEVEANFEYHDKGQYCEVGKCT